MYRFLKQCWRFLAYVFRRFYDGGCANKAAALTFTTLLSVVPLIAVSFAILAAFPAFSSFGVEIQEFIISNFVASSGKVIQGYLKEFVQHASQLSVLSLSFLFITAVMMMFTIEYSFNEIWNVKRQRHFGAALLLYWGVLTISPIILGIGLVISSTLATLAPINKTFEFLGIADTLLPLISFLLSSALFTILYILVPNCRVRILHGLLGGLVAGFLFEVAKEGFGIYLNLIPTYRLLYGALAAIPIFFLWVYLSWLIILFGAVITQAIAFQHNWKGEEKLDGFTHAICWLGYFWQAQKDGKSLTFQELVQNDLFEYAVEPEDQLEILIKSKLIHQTDNGTYMLSRDLSNFTLRDLYYALPWKLPTVEQLKTYNLQMGPLLGEKLQASENGLSQHLNTPLAQVYTQDFIPAASR